ncbi:MAG TPA: signal peptide peptidase SppA [Thermoanaerobaculia bacterium]
MSEFEPTHNGGQAPTPVAPPAPVGGGQAPPPVPASAPQKSRAGVFFLGALSGCAILFVLGFFLVAAIVSSRTQSGEFSLSSQKIAIIPIEGEILDARDTIDLLRKYNRNSMVKAIVVRINSPGGAIAPSQEIYSEIRRMRAQSGKPVIASVDSVGASGGYYIAAACDEIVANPGSITGSIGVILDWMNVEDLIHWAHMKRETITSGAMKAAGSPYRELTDAERQYLQRVVGQLHLQFVKAVAAGRIGKISEAQIAGLADGRVFTGEEALQLHLIDRLGSLGDAVSLAAHKAGIRGEPTTIYPRRREHSLFDLLSNSDESRSMIERIAARQIPQFLYRW